MERLDSLECEEKPETKDVLVVKPFTNQANNPGSTWVCGYRGYALAQIAAGFPRLLYRNQARTLPA